MIEKFGNTKGVIIRGKSKKYRQYNGQKVEDTKGVIIKGKSEKYRKYNGQKKREKDKQ